MQVLLPAQAVTPPAHPCCARSQFTGTALNLALVLLNACIDLVSFSGEQGLSLFTYEPRILVTCYGYISHMLWVWVY